MGVDFQDDLSWCGSWADMEKDGWIRGGFGGVLVPGRQSPEQYVRLSASNANALSVRRPITARQSGIISWTMRVSGTVASTTRVCAFGDGTVDHLGLAFDANGFAQLYRGATQIGASDRQVLIPSTPTRFELKYAIDDAAGLAELRANGATVLSLNGVDTRNDGNAYINSMFFGNLHNDINTDYTMFVAQDLTGDNADFLGDVRLDYPALNGDVAAAWTRSGGAANYQAVDEAVLDTADYVASATVGAEDEYSHGGMSATPTSIFVVEVVAVHRKSDAGTRTFETFLRSGGVRTGSGDVAMTTGNLVAHMGLARDPNGNVAWTKAAFDAATVGVKVTS